MITTHHTKTKRLKAALGVAAAAAVAPAVLLAGAGTAHACDIYSPESPYTIGYQGPVDSPCYFDYPSDQIKYDQGVLDSQFGLSPHPYG